MKYQLTRLLLKGLYRAVGLPTLVLVSLLGATPSLAAFQGSNPTTENDSETIVSGFFDMFEDAVEAIDIFTGNDVNDVGDIINTVDEVRQLFEQRAAEQRAEEERQLRELERIRIQEEREAVARAAAEQRRQYFESLTPEQQQAYVAEQQRLQQQQINMISQFFLEALVSSSIQPDQGDYRQGMSETEYYCYIDPNCGR